MYKRQSLGINEDPLISVLHLADAVPEGAAANVWVGVYGGNTGWKVGRRDHHFAVLVDKAPCLLYTSFAARRRPIDSGVVQIGLKRVDNGSNTYSVATFRMLQKFDGEELLQIKQ